MNMMIFWAASVAFLLCACGNTQTPNQSAEDNQLNDTADIVRLEHVVSYAVQCSGGLPSGDPNCQWRSKVDYDFVLGTGFSIQGCYDPTLERFADDVQGQTVVLSAAESMNLNNAFDQADFKTLNGASFFNTHWADEPSLHMTVSTEHASYQVKFVQSALDTSEPFRALLDLLYAHQMLY